MAKTDFYEVLGLSRGAGEKDIKSAYRRLARKFHPDVNPGDKSAEEKFKQVSEAYQVLSDPGKKKMYDQFGMAAFEQGAPPPGGGRGGAGGPFRWTTDFSGSPFGGFHGGGMPNLNDLFSDLFGARTGFGGEQIFDDAAPGDGQDIVHRVEISLRDAVMGRTVELNLNRPVECRQCSGKGRTSRGRSQQKCPECGGTGQRRPGRMRMRIAQPCPACGGTGTAPGEQCYECGGHGHVEGSERLSVKIPPGVDTGSKVRVAGKGYPGQRGGQPGDLFLDVVVPPDPQFRREGLNLRSDLDVPFQTAVLGGKLDVDTIDGQVKLSIPPGTQGGQVLRLSGKGVPPLGGRGKRGDHLVRINITVPKSTSPKARALLEELAREIKM
jgi:molecular chaperone DnaJ